MSPKAMTNLERVEHGEIQVCLKKKRNMRSPTTLISVFVFNALMLSDACVRQYTNHHWFR